jgi:lipid II:glycine glycyltransferase (peptidoglycan interpeptide bridge formation enzyme)
MGNSCRSIELRSEKSRSTVCGVETVHSFGRRSIALAPFGLYAHPTERDDLGASVRDFVTQLKTFSTVTFEWNVRFDHESLARELVRRGIPFSRSATHALLLEGDYKTSFAKFSSTTRRYVRRAQSGGVLVRRTHDADDIRAYYEVHRKLASQKGNYHSLYPKAIFDELVKLHEDVVFLVAGVGTSVVGGAWFFRDGRMMFYWHGATDREYSRYYPSYAIQAYAIRMAHEEGRSIFNFGGSVGIASLEQFKSGWGAEPHYCWHFIWQNPLWRMIQNIRSSWRQHA